MNCNLENRRDYLEAKIRGWRELAVCGIDRFERSRGRRNLRRLASAHPEVASDCAVNEHSSPSRHEGRHA